MKAFPTLIVLDSQGMERDRQVGYDGQAENYVQRLEDWAENENTLVALLQTWSKDTTDVEWNYRIAHRYEERFQIELAQRFWQNIIDLDHENVAGYKEEAEFNRALYRARYQKDTDPLEKLIEQEKDVELLERGYFTLIRAAEVQGDHDKTLAIYRRAMERLPDYANLMNGCAWYIYEKRLDAHYPWGIELAEQAVQLEPDAAHIWDTLAWLYNESGQYKLAVEAMTKALELEPESDYFKQTLFKMKTDLQEKG